MLRYLIISSEMFELKCVRHVEASISIDMIFLCSLRGEFYLEINSNTISSQNVIDCRCFEDIVHCGWNERDMCNGKQSIALRFQCYEECRWKSTWSASTFSNYRVNKIKFTALHCCLVQIIKVWLRTDFNMVFIILTTTPITFWNLFSAAWTTIVIPKKSKTIKRSEMFEWWFRILLRQ